MGKLSMNDWPPFKKKKKKIVDSCTPGDPDCDTASDSGDKKHKTKQPIPTGGTHMNMNNLGGSPGDVTVNKKDSSSSVTATQEQRARGNEDKVAVQMARIAKRKAMLDTLTGKKRKKADQTNMMP